MAFQCPECGASTPSPYVCTSCGKALAPRETSPRVPAPTGQPAPAQSATSTPSLDQNAARIEAAIKNDHRRRGLTRLATTLVGLALVAAGGVAFSRFYERHVPMRWSEDPMLPELMRAVIHDRRADRHAIEVFCMDLAMWTEQLRDRQEKTRPTDQAALFADAVNHWEPIDDGCQEVSAQQLTPDAAPLMAKCSEYSKQLGAFLPSADTVPSNVRRDQLTAIARGIRKAVASH